MAGFMPAIHAFDRGEKDVDGREHQGVYALFDGFWRGHDAERVMQHDRNMR